MRTTGFKIVSSLVLVAALASCVDNDFRTISPYIMLMAFAVAHTTVPEARVPIACSDTAMSPPVCEIFKEFCDCAACLVLDRQGACDLCPNL